MVALVAEKVYHMRCILKIENLFVSEFCLRQTLLNCQLVPIVGTTYHKMAAHTTGLIMCVMTDYCES